MGVDSAQVKARDVPAVFYTDITSGPNTGGENNNGCYLTIAGKGFGYVRGSSTVTIGGGEVAEYKVWTDTEISVQIGPNARTGPIIVTVNAQRSTTVDLVYRETGDIQFTIRDADIWFMAEDGDNANPGTFELPKATVRASGGVKSVMQGGDFLYIRGGTYTERDDSYGSFFFLNLHGSEGAPTVISGYAGETVSLLGGSRGMFHTYTPSGGEPHDYVIAHLVMNRAGNCVYLLGFSRVWLVDLDMSGLAGQTGCLGTAGGSYLYVYGCNVHDNGPSANHYAHLLYISAKRFSDFRPIEYAYFGWNVIHDTTNEVNGLHFYTEPYGSSHFDQIYVHDNLFFNITRSGLNLSAGGNMRDAWAWNNVFYNCGYSELGAMWLGNGADYSLHVYNNTIYDSPSGHVNLGTGRGTLDIKNNIFYSTDPSQKYLYETYGGWDDDLITMNNNLFYGAGDSYPLDTNPISGDPQFVNPGVHDFHLQETSPARDAGTSDVSSVVRTDFDGVPRGEWFPYDIGAYEYSGGTPVIGRPGRAVAVREVR